MKLTKKLTEATALECERLLGDLKGVLAVVVASQDGFDIANCVSNGIDPERIAAMASSISALGAVVTQEAAIGNSQSVTVKTEDGFAYIIGIHIQDKPYILNLIASNSAILGQVIYHCSEAQKRLNTL